MFRPCILAIIRLYNKRNTAIQDVLESRKYNRKICINYMVKKQLYIFTRDSTLGIQLHVSALYIGHHKVVQ